MAPKPPSTNRTTRLLDRIRADIQQYTTGGRPRAAR